MKPANDDPALARRPANWRPLTPLHFLDRAAAVFPDHTAIVHGEARIPYRQFRDRSVRLAHALTRLGVRRGDAVAVLLPNVPAMLEAHFGVPMSGGVLAAINTRLDAGTIAYILDHCEAKLFIVEREHAPLARAALAQAAVRPALLEVADATTPATHRDETLGGADYEDALANADPGFAWLWPEDEWDAIALNYTSGTTGRPKGVLYHHRGAHLLAIGNVLAAQIPRHPVYLWTLPMFHCNGWCFPWTITALAGTHVCLRAVRGAELWRLMSTEGVSHLCGAPIVMKTILETPEADRRPLPRPVTFLVAAAPPPEAVLRAMREAGFGVVHVYGLTEVYGPAVVNEWHEAWNGLPMAEQARLMARQGVRYLALEELAVLDPETMRPVPADGSTLGEVMMRGNVVMKGYLKDAEATEKAFAEGWFHTGDLAVIHPDGYVQLKDRAKDIIISGGENISSIEVEDVLYAHPAVAAVAVVAKPDEKWGETPLAFVELKPGGAATAEELIAFARERLAHYKAPRQVVFTEIPKTSTGKIQKHLLRAKAKEMAGG